MFKSCRKHVKRAGIIVTTLLITLTAASQNCQAQVAIDNTYSSKYVWRGYDIFGENSAYMPSVDFTLGAGFSLNVWAAVPLGSGSEALSELDYTVAYGTTVMEGETLHTDVSFNYIYYDFYKVGSATTPDTEEVGVGLSMPNILGGSISPSIYYGKLYTNESVGFDVDGDYISVGLSGDVSVSDTIGLSLAADINYNGGLFGADHDWSHMTFTASTSMEVGSVSLSPFATYQVSMDSSVNTEDEFWGGVSTSFSF